MHLSIENAKDDAMPSGSHIRDNPAQSGDETNIEEKKKTVQD